MEALTNPNLYETIEAYVGKFGSASRIHQQYSLALFGTRAKMSAFGVVDDRTRSFYSTTHCWVKNSAYLYRRTQPRKDYFEALFDRQQFEKGDVTMSHIIETVQNRIPILQAQQFELSFGNIETRIKPVRVISLLDGAEYWGRTMIHINNQPSLLLNLTTYPSHSGMGFVTDSGALFLISAGIGRNFERTALVPTTAEIWWERGL